MAIFPFTVRWALPHILFYVLLLLHARHGYAATTHHLTVSVEGNTPTLIVTSAQIGITPKIVHTTTTATPVSTLSAHHAADTSAAHIEEFVNKGSAGAGGGGAAKLKAKSYKMQYSKKWQQALRQREKSNLGVATTTSTNTEALKATTTRTTPQTFRDSTQATATGESNIVTASASTLASSTTVTVNDKPTRIRNAPSAQDVINTPDAIMSTVAGNMPQTTEMASRVTLASSKTTKATSEALFVEETTQTMHAGPKAQVALAGDTTLSEKLTTMPTYTELHDTTAAAAPATKHNAPKNTTLTQTTEPSLEQASSSRTTKVATGRDAFETLPEAFNVMVTTTTTTPLKTTAATAVVTSAFAVKSNVDGTQARLALTTNPAYTTSVNDIGVNQDVPITTDTDRSSTTITSSVNEKVCTNISANLETPDTPVAEHEAIAIQQTSIKVNVTPTTTTRMKSKDLGEQETSTLISTTKPTTTTAMTTEATTKSAIRKQITTQKGVGVEELATDSGIIFIDDAADNREDKPNVESGELQNDEAVAVAGRPAAGEVEASENADGVHDSKVGVIKLIDLERHDLKSIAKAKQYKLNNNKNDTSGYDEDDDGHDGVKRTRKKQLTDKHFLAATNSNISVEKHDTTTRASPLRDELVEIKATVKTSTEKIAKEITNQIETFTHATAPARATAQEASTTVEPTPTQRKQQQTKKDTTSVSKSTLKPVHNGYLGPILMEEKRFSVLHANKKPHEHHESTIESQLRHGRLVEILAPTAILEQTTTKPQQTIRVEVNKEATTTAEPVRGAFVHAFTAHRPPMLSTTVFQVPESLGSTTRLPLNDKSAQNADARLQIHSEVLQHKQQQQPQQQQLHSTAPQIVNNARTESKISDIQVEVYDSTVDSIVASTNFKDSDGFYALPQAVEAEQHIGTTKPPAAPQERFTQYVVDRVDYATQQASPAPLHHSAAGLPEPAAIEIHINVSEGIGNESEDLEFSYHQPDYTGSSSRTTLNEALNKSPKAFPLKSHRTESASRSTESNTRENIERGDEILVVEIIDTGENSTEAAMSAENVNPIFTFRSDAETDVELKDIKYFPPEVKVKPPQMSDELFLADMTGENALPKPPLPPPPPPRKPTIDRDSDTIFYISNTEVKVGESLPTSNTNFEQQQQQQQQLRKTKLENQFFPANYLASTHPNAEQVGDQPSQRQHHRYVEDIILSPVQNTADSLKIFRSQGDGAPPLDVTYVGESVMEVEQSSGAGATTTVSAPSLLPDVIIQPAILPEMSIGVPVIGELPPQIELKEIDFMPDEANQQHSGMYEHNMLEENGDGGAGNLNGNDVDRIVESSVQYGGDLIDESIVGGGFDGVEDSYPFGNPMALHNKAHHANDFAHFIVNHGVNNLRKDELSVDVASSGETTAGQQAAASAVATATMLHNLENGEIKELLERNANETLPLSMLGNGTYPLDEHISNATAKSVMKESNTFMMDQYSILILILIGLLLLVLVSTAFCALWLLYIKHQIASGRKTAQSQASGNGKNIAENGKSDEKSTILTTTSIPKQQPPTFIDMPSNGNFIETLPHTTKPSIYTNNKNVSNGTNVAALINCNAKSVEEVLLLPTDEPIAISSLNSMSTPLKPNDNNKLQTEVNVNPSSNNSVQDDFTRPNGSVTKMTLKNNHLIVETEERHDISRDARETTMHYNTSEKDGVFVVEVARGIDSKSIPNSPTTEEPRPIYESQPPVDAAVTLLRTEDEKVLRNHDEIQIHQPPPETIQQQPHNCIAEIPERSLHQIIELEEPAVSPNSFREDAAALNENDERALVRNSNTGLSQSDLSSTSSTGSNKRYSYGNQELYTVEPTGYVTSSPTNNLTLARQSAHDLADDDDRRSENGHSLAHSPAVEGNAGANTNLSEDQVVCEKLANNEQSREQAISENAINARQFVEESDKAAKNDELEIGTENGQQTSTIEAVLQTAVVVKDVVQRAQDGVAEEVDELNGEVTELVANEKTEDKEEIENIDTKEPIDAGCINNNNNTTEEMDAQLELVSASEAEANAELAVASEVEAKATSLRVESKENVECKINVDRSQGIELSNDGADALHAFPQTIACNYGYDSIISLPDPPSTEEIKQLAAFTIIDNNQLDSLPPPSPPPPPTFADFNDNRTTIEVDTNDEQTTNKPLATEDEITATQMKLQQILQNKSKDVPTMEHETTTLTNGNSYDTTNGNITKTGGIALDVNGHETSNGHEHEAEVLTAHLELNTSSSNTDGNSTGTPLTPPDSPPLSSPLHYNNSASAISAINGVNRGMCNGSLPVAVNVNGS